MGILPFLTFSPIKAFKGSTQRFTLGYTTTGTSTQGTWHRHCQLARQLKGGETTLLRASSAIRHHQDVQRPTCKRSRTVCLSARTPHAASRINAHNMAQYPVLHVQRKYNDSCCLPLAPVRCQRLVYEVLPFPYIQPLT